jgi:class 3 adenylate cyclase
MDQGVLLVVLACALVVVVAAWATREIVLAVRRRRHPPPEPPPLLTTAAAALLPLVLQPVASLVDHIGRNRRTVESLVGPDGTVSLMFCDIEGSTALNHRIGDDEWVRLIRAHDRVVASTVRRHKGQVVKTQGDGFMAAFPTPRQAVAAAVSLGPDLCECEAIDVHLAVRVGVHTGEVVSEKGDLFGTNVAMAARIAAAARGNEVLVSEVVREQLVDHDGFELHRRRTAHFKGLPGRHRIYAVTAV